MDQPRANIVFNDVPAHLKSGGTTINDHEICSA
jgi:hypothetical protein